MVIHGKNKRSSKPKLNGVVNPVVKAINIAMAKLGSNAKGIAYAAGFSASYLCMLKHGKRVNKKNQARLLQVLDIKRNIFRYYDRKRT